MRIVILDTETGERKDCSEFAQGTDDWYWTEGNGSCDCNREIAFCGIEETNRRKDVRESWGICLGCKRYLIVDSDEGDYFLREANSEYPKELVAKFLPHLSVEHGQ